MGACIHTKTHTITGAFTHSHTNTPYGYINTHTDNPYTIRGAFTDTHTHTHRYPL